ncbi:hypothetical protein IW261DRAFT_266361 [Armillaria novae-zelandiae]|uniref:Uncharacterized protein n=1 Tax=Armillaria novae-zelandiae TaxID=153914 RepID=A0AA39U913_9AGAR|nr:hypothetical protein IW261DRAFT_266361 [Armillaria novae-zelandiae]
MKGNVSYFDEATVYTMQVIGCTVTLINQTAVVDAQSHLLQRVYPLGRKTSSIWSQWNPETIPANATVSSSPQGTTTIYARSEPTPYRIKRQSTNTTEPNPGSTGGPQPQNPDPEPPRPPPAPQGPDPEPAPPSSGDTSSSSQPGGNTSQQGSNNTPTSSAGNSNSGQQDSGQQNGGDQQNNGPSQQNSSQQAGSQSTSASTTSKAPSSNGNTSSSSSNGQAPSSIPTSTSTSNLSVSKVETGGTTQHSSTSISSSTAAATSSGQFGSVTYYGMSDVFLDVWWELFSQAAVSRFPSTDDCPGFPWSNSEACNPLTVVEQFVMEDLGLHSILLDSPVRPAPKITLHDLENSLASATAASYWAALYAKAGGLKDDDPYNVENVNNYQVESMTGNATISYPFTATRLNINLTPLILGLLASIGLLLLVFWLVGKPVEGDSGIDTIGVLQIVWLMRTRPDLQRIVSDVNEPTVENVRESGMVYTSMHGHGSAETHPSTNG